MLIELYAIRSTLYAIKDEIRFTLHEIAPLHLSRTLYKSALFMQNKANFEKAKMNVSAVKTKDYENNRLGGRGKNKPNTNPIKPNTKPIKANKMPKQTQYKPNQTQFQTQPCKNGSSRGRTPLT